MPNQRQVSITVVGSMDEVVQAALKAFDEADTTGKALTRALFDWHHQRKADSKRSVLDRIEQQLTEQRSEIAKLSAKITELLQHPPAPTNQNGEA